MGRYDDLVEVVERLRKALNSVGPDSAAIEAIVVLAQGGKLVGVKNARKVFTDIFPTIAPTLKARKEFRIALDALQKVFDTEVDEVMKFTDELDWFLHSKSRLVEELRFLLTGVDLDDLRFLLNVTGERALSMNNIVRNSYLPKIEPAFRAMLNQSKQRLDELLHGSEAVIRAFQTTGLITDFNFWKIKGEVMEILALEIKKSYLAKHPNGILIEGVMAMTTLTRKGQVTKSRTPRQIWDGVIVEVTSSGLKILVKFEIKSGLQGFREGFNQVLSTHYNRFRSFGDELRVTLADGTERIFTINKKSGPDAIDDVAEHVLIVPRGESLILPNQRISDDEITLTSRLLTIGNVEIEHSDIEALVMDFLKGLKLK